jgi:hypothetical protein
VFARRQLGGGHDTGPQERAPACLHAPLPFTIPDHPAPLTPSLSRRVVQPLVRYLVQGLVACYFRPTPAECVELLPAAEQLHTLARLSYDTHEREWARELFA